MSKAGVPKTVYIDLQGKGNWVNVQRPDEYGKWGCVLYPNEESLTKIKKLKSGWVEGVEGIKNELKMDDDGYFIRLSRPQKKETRTKIITFNPPHLFKEDGETPLINTLVGNGSDITCNIECYFFNTPQKKLGSAIRLQSIRVDSLIAYEGKRDLDEQGQIQMKALAEVPPPNFEGWK